MRVAALAAIALLWLLPATDVRADVADGILWGDLTHMTKGELGAWLAQRGASYSTWAERHPWAAERLEADVFASPPKIEGPVDTPVVSVSNRKGKSVVALVMLALATALLAVASLPRAVVPAALAGPYPSWRLVAAAGGLAVLVGWAVVALTATP